MTTYATPNGTIVAYVRLIGDGGAFDLDRPHWTALQLLALLHGWEPMGTIDDRGPASVNRGYHYNAGEYQLVGGADAAAIGAALVRALPTLTALDEHGREPRLDQLGWPGVMTDQAPPRAEQRDAFGTWAPAQMRRRLEHFIRFSADGEGFRIGMLFIESRVGGQARGN